MDIDELTEQFEWLDDLRDEGSINMLGAKHPLSEAFNLNKDETRNVLSLWMNTYDGKSTARDRALRALGTGED